MRSCHRVISCKKHLEDTAWGLCARGGFQVVDCVVERENNFGFISNYAGF